MEQHTITLDGRTYRLDVRHDTVARSDMPRLVIVSYMPSMQSFHTLRVCVQAIQRFTPEDHEIWVIDNCSPQPQVDRLASLPGINIALNRTKPLPPESRGLFRFGQPQTKWGSYANAVALELGIRLIDASTRHVMTLHMDTMPCRDGWLSYLRSKLTDRVRAAGVRMDTARLPEGILHVLGYLVDFQEFRRLNLDFFPNLPELDVGDRVTVGLRKAGYDVVACPNSLWQPELLDTLPTGSPYRTLHVDRSFDDQGNVIFLHLGRGVRKSTGDVVKGATTEEWIRFADEHLLTGQPSRAHE